MLNVQVTGTITVIIEGLGEIEVCKDNGDTLNGYADLAFTFLSEEAASGGGNDQMFELLEWDPKDRKAVFCLKQAAE